jgi:hypothetical protein
LLEAWVMTMLDGPPELILAGRPTRGCWSGISRYCGLPWDDNPPETWGCRSYDVESDPHTVTPRDVTAAGALHPGISQADLSWYCGHRRELEEWLTRLPTDVSLKDVESDAASAIISLPALADGMSISLLSKVLHRKRPMLIPVIDRALVDHYRPLTGLHRVVEVWQPLLSQIADDLRTNVEELGAISVVLQLNYRRFVLPLRVIHIAITMDGHGLTRPGCVPSLGRQERHRVRAICNHGYGSR